MRELPVVGAVELLDDLALRRLLRVAEDLLCAPPVVDEALLQERDDLALEAPDQRLRRGDVHQVAVPEHVVPIDQHPDLRIHRLQVGALLLLEMLSRAPLSEPRPGQDGIAARSPSRTGKNDVR
ncbi:MAG TPA: hypothetical protein PLL76_22995 [Thermoanaerobaculia bacterium]|nr:hypothetical protein [Thermoanaerobaculia bacterium]HQP89134.1 hypothetical protein [Thermoanaerobaculia bacterium]